MLYDGGILYKDSSDNIYDIYYCDGEFDQSNKNLQLYKGYCSIQPNYEYKKYSKTHNDGVTIPYEQMYKTKPSGIKSVKNRETSKVHTIIKKGANDRPSFLLI